MSKLILYLLLLFNISICEQTKKPRDFDYHGGFRDRIEVNLGEEFYINFRKSSLDTSWFFLNKNDTQGSLQYLRYYNTFRGRLDHIVGPIRYDSFRFKALKNTNEDVILKFNYGRFWKNTHSPTTTFYVNVK